MTINRKTFSNRRNAAKSTGPRSIAGKERSSLNAVSHGLSAQHLVDDAARNSIANLTKLLVQGSEDDPVMNRLAGEAAEAQVMLERLRILRIRAWENAANTPSIVDHEKNPKTGLGINQVSEGISDLSTRDMQVVMSNIEALPFLPRLENDFMVVDLATKELSRYIRYERQAANRRDRALRDIEGRRKQNYW